MIILTRSSEDIFYPSGYTVLICLYGIHKIQKKQIIQQIKNISNQFQKLNFHRQWKHKKKIVSSNPGMSNLLI